MPASDALLRRGPGKDREIEHHLCAGLEIRLLPGSGEEKPGEADFDRIERNAFELMIGLANAAA